MKLEININQLIRVGAMFLSESPMDGSLKAFHPIGNVYTTLLYDPETKSYMVGDFTSVYPYFITTNVHAALEYLSASMLGGMDFEDGYSLRENFDSDKDFVEFLQYEKPRVAYPHIIPLVHA